MTRGLEQRAMAQGSARSIIGNNCVETLNGHA
jgi:hypothetical protein